MKQEQVQKTKSTTKTGRAAARRVDRFALDHRSPSGLVKHSN